MAFKEVQFIERKENHIKKQVQQELQSLIFSFNYPFRR